MTASNSDPIRCMLAMLGSDVHSKGLRTLARLLTDAGIDVIYLGEHNTTDDIVNALKAEHVDVLGLSYSLGTYMHYTEELLDKMRAAHLDKIPVMLGGLIHQEDVPVLHRLGVAEVFGPNHQTSEIYRFLEQATGKSLA